MNQRYKIQVRQMIYNKDIEELSSLMKDGMITTVEVLENSEINFG